MRTHPSSVLGIWLAALLAVLLAAPASAAAADSEASAAPKNVAQTPLQRSLAAVVGSKALRGAKVSALVVRERDGAILFDHEADRPLIPASNTKVLTALASLDGFGPAHRFETTIFSDAPPDAEGAIGTLVVRGSGDPTINSEDWWRLAMELRTRGVRSVGGDLVLDDSALDAVRWHPALGPVSSRAYHAPVGAINANYGSFEVSVRPGSAAGDPARVDVNPPVSYFELSSAARTVDGKQRPNLVVGRSHAPGRDIIDVRGRVPVGRPPRSFYRSVSDPTAYAGSVLRMQLEAVGIEVAGETRAGSVPEGAFELHVFKGKRVAQIVRLLMKYSNNAIAETMLKNLGALAEGAPGSWPAGVREMRRRLIALGLDPQSFDLVDGSGLSYENRVSPRALVRALSLVRESFAFGPEFIASMPIAGRDGTLEKRAKSSLDRVRGKTGLLNNVTTLSGFALDANDELLIFSILVNDYRVTDETAMKAVDRFLAVLTSEVGS